VTLGRLTTEQAQRASSIVRFTGCLDSLFSEIERMASAKVVASIDRVNLLIGSRRDLEQDHLLDRCAEEG